MARRIRKHGQHYRCPKCSRVIKDSQSNTPCKDCQRLKRVRDRIEANGLNKEQTPDEFMAFLQEFFGD